MNEFPIDPHGNDWSPKAMADRLDNIGSLSDDDAAILDRIALELRAASVVAEVAAMVALVGVAPPPVAHTKEEHAELGTLWRRINAIQAQAMRDGWKAPFYREQLRAALPDVPEAFLIGPLTMDEVFKPAGLTNLSDTQAVLDAVEKALARV